jgi:hypothetical protein
MDNQDKHTLKGRLHPEVLKYLSANAAKGGRVKSSRKAKANRINGKKPKKHKAVK